MASEADNWFRQAKADFVAAGHSASLGDYYLAVFSYQQAAEKALKAVLIKTGKEIVKTHDLVFLGRLVGLPKSFWEGAQKLSSEYLVSRYGFVEDKAPVDSFNEDDVRQAAVTAEGIVEWCHKKI